MALNVLRRGSCAAVTAAMLVFGTAGSAEILEQVLVKVNGDIITKTDLEKRQVAALRQRNISPSGDELQRWGLPRRETLAIAVSLAGDEELNPHGVPGRSDVAENALGGESLPGHGQHGGLGTYEQRPFLALRGGGVAAGRHDRDASLIDLAPTFLRHLALPAEGMDGSPLSTH